MTKGAGGWGEIVKTNDPKDRAREAARRLREAGRECLREADSLEKHFGLDADARADAEAQRRRRQFKMIAGGGALVAAVIRWVTVQPTVTGALASVVAGTVLGAGVVISGPLDNGCAADVPSPAPTVTRPAGLRRVTPQPMPSPTPTRTPKRTAAPDTPPTREPDGVPAGTPTMAPMSGGPSYGEPAADTPQPAGRRHRRTYHHGRHAHARHGHQHAGPPRPEVRLHRERQEHPARRRHCVGLLRVGVCI